MNKKKQVKGYKVFNPDWTCNDFQYEVGNTYHHNGSIGLCREGFHFCEKLANCFNYYSFDPENKVAEVIATGEIIKGDDKCVTNNIEIVREISWNDVLNLVNTGISNTGLCNSGNWNSGNWNTGNWNSGNWNTKYKIYSKDCKYNNNCSFKQLARKTQECEELKKQLETVEKWRIKAEGLNENFELKNTCYRKALEEIERYCRQNRQAGWVDIEGIIDIISKAKGEE